MIYSLTHPYIQDTAMNNYDQPLSSRPWEAFHKDFWAHNPNIVKFYFAFVAKIIIKSDHTFAHALVVD